MRQIKIKSYLNTNDKVIVTISKDIPYVEYNGEYIRVNTDATALSDVEKEVFPRRLKGDICKYISTEKVRDANTVEKSAYYNDCISVQDIFEAIERLAANSDMQSKIIYKSSGVKSNSGDVTISHTYVRALLLGHMYVPVITSKEESLDKDFDSLYEFEGLNSVIKLQTTSSVSLRFFSDIDVSIVNNKKVIIRNVEKDDTYAETLINTILGENKLEDEKHV